MYGLRKRATVSVLPYAMEWTPAVKAASSVPEWKVQDQPLRMRGASPMKVTTIGIDLAKNVLQVHGVDEQGKVALRKQLRVVR